MEKEEWVRQLQNSVNTLERLEQYIQVTPQEREGVLANTGRWGTTPHFASLMDPVDPGCPIRRQVVPSVAERENRFGIDNYLIWKENRDADDDRPASIGRQYRDRIAFTITQVCAIYCRYCFRKEVTFGEDLQLRFDVDAGIEWIRKHTEIRDVLITGGDPLMLSDAKLEYVIRKLREIPHVEMIRIGSRLPVVLPQRITPGLRKVLGGYHRVPIWVIIHCNHPKEITELTSRAVYDLLTCGISVGNQAVLLKGINDDVQTFRDLHVKLINNRVRPYYLFYCEQVKGADHFRTPVEKGAELIRDALRGHVTGLAQPMYVVATRIGKIPLMPDYHIVGRSDGEVHLRNYKGDLTSLPEVPEDYEPGLAEPVFSEDLEPVLQEIA